MTEIRVERIRSPLRVPWHLRFKIWRHRRKFKRDLAKVGITEQSLRQALDRAFFWGTDEVAEWAVQREAELRARAYARHCAREAGRAFVLSMRRTAEAMNAFAEGMREVPE